MVLLMEEEQIRQRVIEIAQELDIDPDIKVEFVSEIPDRVFAQEPVIVYASERRMLFNLQKFNDFVGDKTTYADCYIAHEVLGTRYHNRSIEYAVPEGIPSRILYEHFVAKFLDTAEDLTIYRNTPDKYLAL